MKKIFSLKSFTIILLALGMASCTQAPTAEPIDIVYGPIDQVYEIPETEGQIYYVSPDGDAAAEGLSLEATTSIESAIAKVVTGDVIIMREGVYRTGNLFFNQGITIQPYKDEKPVLNGTLIADNWQQDADSLWFTQWNYLFPGQPEDWWVRERNEEFTPLHRFNNDVVFIDGQYLQSAGSKAELNEGTFFVDYENSLIYIGANPEGKTVEISAFRKAIHRVTGEVHGKQSDGRGPILKGLTITQYPDTMVHIDGYYPQGISSESEHGKDVVGTVFYNCSFTKSMRIGVFAIGDSMQMRSCLIEDSNTEGLYIVGSSDVLLERNIFGKNNIEKWTGFFPSAVKIFNQTHRVVCRENLITNNPNSNGLWYDVGNEGGVFVNNRVENVGSPADADPDKIIWSSFNGFFFEISDGVLVAGNVFVNNDQGLLILNSSNAEIYNNTFVNSTAGFGRNDRGDEKDHFGWHITTGPDVDSRENHVFVNNLMIQTMPLGRPMLNVWQPAFMCERLSEPTLKQLNNNVYLSQQAEHTAPLIVWSPFDNEECSGKIFATEEITALYPEFESNSFFYKGYEGALLLEDEKVAAEFEGHKYAAEIPDYVKTAAGWPLDDKTPFIGAK